MSFSDFSSIIIQFKNFIMKLFTSLVLAFSSEACSAKKELPPGFEIGSDDITPGLSCSAAPGDNRVVGGDIAEKGTWPWLVTLDVVDENGLAGLCGGTILSDTRILTRLFYCMQAFQVCELQSTYR